MTRQQEGEKKEGTKINMIMNRKRKDEMGQREGVRIKIESKEEKEEKAEKETGKRREKRRKEKGLADQRDNKDSIHKQKDQR